MFYLCSKTKSQMLLKGLIDVEKVKLQDRTTTEKSS